MKALLLDAAPEGDTVVVPVGDPLWVPGFVDANARCYRAAPYAGRVALSVPCPTCEGRGYDKTRVRHISNDDQGSATYADCLTCHGKGRLIWGTAMVKFVRVKHTTEPRTPPNVVAGPYGAVLHMKGHPPAMPISGTFTPGQWAAVLTDVRPTTERCPACWRTADLPGHVTRKGWCEPCLCLGKTPPIPHDGSQEWEP